MADRFYKDIELPDLTGVTPSAPDSGFIQIYGKQGKLAYQAADGIEVIVGEQTSQEQSTNSFATINANGTLVVADTPTDTLLLNQGTGISIAGDALTDAVTITNTDTGSSAVAAHVAASDPHPQYLTQTEADALYQATGASSGATFQHAVLTATQANNTTTEQTLTGHTFTIPPGKAARIDGILIFTSAATTTGAFYGVQVTQGAGANGNAVGSWLAYVNISSAATATGLADGDVFNLAGGASTPAGAGVLGTATVAGNNSARLSCIVKNNSTNVTTTVNIRFRSETTSAITAQIGTSASCIVS